MFNIFTVNLVVIWHLDCYQFISFVLDVAWSLSDFIWLIVCERGGNRNMAGFLAEIDSIIYKQINTSREHISAVEQYSQHWILSQM